MTSHTGLGISEIIGDKREAILALAGRYGASNVRIFGSVARGEADVNSDVDFLVHFEPDRDIWDVVALWQALTDLLGCEVSLIPDDDLLHHPSKRFWQAVSKDVFAL